MMAAGDIGSLPLNSGLCSKSSFQLVSEFPATVLDAGSARSKHVTQPLCASSPSSMDWGQYRTQPGCEVGGLVSLMRLEQCLAQSKLYVSVRG